MMSRAFLRQGMFIKFTLGFFLVVAMYFSLTPESLAGPSSHATCQGVFTDKIETSSLPLIAMDPVYFGEEKGLFIDPLTRTPWKVRYLSEKERAPLELFIKNGKLVDLKNQSAESQFDFGTGNFQHSLLVIDANFRIFFLPFEQRGLYHHSSLSRGEKILFAGTMIVSNGVVKELSNNSGHYKPTTRQTLLVLQEIHKKGLDLRFAKISGPVALDLMNTPSMTPAELQMFLLSL